MEIVASSNMIRRFKTIKEYVMDLGMSKSSEAKKDGQNNTGQVVIKIKDPFVKRYSLEFGTYIDKMGSVGTLGFYTDNLYPPNTFKIFDENKIYEFTYTDSSEDVRSYLSKKLNEIFDEELNPIVLDTNLEETMSFEYDKNLPQEEFLEQYMAARKKMDESGVKLRRG